MTGPLIVAITHVNNWRHGIWDADVPSRPGFLVHCSEHGKLADGWAYAERIEAEQTRAKHLRRYHGGAS